MELIDLLVSPCCHTPVTPSKGIMHCSACYRCYPLQEGIPALMPQAAFYVCSGCKTRDTGKPARIEGNEAQCSECAE